MVTSRNPKTAKLVTIGKYRVIQGQWPRMTRYLPIVTKLAIFGFLEVRRPNIWLIFHITCFSSPLHYPASIITIGPLPSGHFSDEGDVAPFRDAALNLLDQNTLTTHHFVQNWTLNTLVKGIAMSLWPIVYKKWPYKCEKCWFLPKIWPLISHSWVKIGQGQKSAALVVSTRREQSACFSLSSSALSFGRRGVCISPPPRLSTLLAMS